MGDTADNIKGIPGRGIAYAKNLLNDLETEDEMKEHVLSAYEEHYGMMGWDMMLENAQLLWIQREGRLTWQ